MLLSPRIKLALVSAASIVGALFLAEFPWGG
jgi:hypothetical protein